MKTVGIKCPFCGGNLEFENGSKPVKCPFCDSQVFLEETENSSVRAGYDFEKGRMKARRDAAKERLEEEKEKVRAQQAADLERIRAQKEADLARIRAAWEEENRKKRRVFWIIGWILCFPVPLTVPSSPFKNAQNIEDFDCRRSVGYLYCNDCERHGVGREKTGRKRF